MTTQTQIAIEQGAASICMAIVRHSGIAWTMESIPGLVRMSGLKTAECINWLIKQNYIFARGTSFALTPMGEEYVAGLSERADIVSPGDALKYKDEALTGFVERWNAKVGRMCGNQSQMTAAVLQTGKSPHASRTPDDMFSDMDRMVQGKDRLRAILKVDSATLDKWLNEGRIHPCSRCGQPAPMRKFGKEKSGKTHWEKVCRECRGKAEK